MQESPYQLGTQLYALILLCSWIINKTVFMKMIFLMAFFFIYAKETLSQRFKNTIIPVVKNELNDNNELENFYKTTTGRINLFIFTRERNKKIDLLSFYTLLRARTKSLFHHRKFYIVNARSSKDACAKVEHILRKKKKLIKNVWFDSHGHYGNHYSSFRIGIDEFSYRNIHDSNAIKYLRIIAKYCDGDTKVGLGSCYAGADFSFPATDSTLATRMNGDSLMIGMGDIFEKSLIYASESWVMAKPGIFTNRLGFAGFPLERRFKDRVYKPVWERIGEWKQYSKQNRQLQSIPTIALDRSGNIHLKTQQYNNFFKTKKRIAKALRNLKP